MRFFSENGLILSVAVLFMTVASANNKVANEPAQITTDKTYVATGTTDAKTAKLLVNLLRNPHLKVKAEAGLPVKNSAKSSTNDNKVYTAHGKTDRKTAMLLINLLRNPHLRVKAEVGSVGEKNIPKKTQQVYKQFTISGKTNPQAVKKLRALLASSKHVEISVQPSTNKVNISQKSEQKQQARQPIYHSYQDYQALISQGKTFYHAGKPPVFMQGNTLWYPVAVKD